MTTPIAMSPRKVQARMKLLHIIARKDLEAMSRRQSPWQSDRRTLEIELCNAWPADDVEMQVAKIMAVARGAL